MTMETATISPLERAARALSVRIYETENQWEDCVEDARAVLQALREPSDGMKTVGAALSYQGDAFAAVECIEDAWRAMIDKALEE